MKKNLIIAMALMMSFFICACKKSGDYVVTGYEVSEVVSLSEEYDRSEETVISMDNEAYVYVCGAVINPGVYKLENGAIKDDAIALAGGFAEGASREYVNLAEHITDGEHIYVPYESELEVSLVYGLSDGSIGETYDGVYSNDGRLNINKASKEDFMTLTGIGETRAEAIVAYREEHGLFGSVEEIMNVSGIKEGVYNSIKDYITLN